MALRESSGNIVINTATSGGVTMVKYSSGIMHLHGTTSSQVSSTAAGSSFVSPGVTVTFFREFTGTPKILCNPNQTVADVLGVVVTAKSNKSFTVKLTGTAVTSAGTIDWIAIGEWF